MAKEKQIDLEEAIAAKRDEYGFPLYEHASVIDGVVFESRARNHYEYNDGVPVAPPVEFNRPSIRQRVENLLNRGVDPLAAYVGSEGIEMDVPDDPDAPLTHAEEVYLDVVASQLAEAAPLPDEGLPRQANTAVPPNELNPPSDGPRTPENETPSPSSAAPPSTVPSR